MSAALNLHNMIDRYNVLQMPTEKISDFFLSHPNLYKVVLIANHIFRAIAMTAFSMVLPFSSLMNLAICFSGSLFYRLTVETNCAYKFALPAFAGSLTLPFAHTAFIRLASGVALASLSAFSSAFLSIASLASYTAYIVLTVDYDVDKKIG